jgi:hypothetical protein
MAVAALQSTAWPTLLDVSRRLDPNGKIAKVAEILNQYNEIYDDIPWLEGNLPTGHKTTLRAAVPNATFRTLNSGVVPVKSTTTQIVDTSCMIENYSEVDKDLAMLNGNTADWRLSEDKPIIEGITQAFVQSLIYGDTTVNPERFMGLAPRYWTITAANSTLAANVLDGSAGSNINSSVWLVVWGPETTFCIYPKGSQAGLQVQDLGEQTIYDGTAFPGAGRYQAYRTHYQLKCGLVIRDWRSVVRIANLNMTNMLTAADGTDNSANLLKFMVRAIEQVPAGVLAGGRPVFYMTKNMRAMLRTKLLFKSNTLLAMEEVTGAQGISRQVLTFMGIPCRRVDQILETEAALT